MTSLKNDNKICLENDQKVFKSIQQILSNPQKIAQNKDDKKYKQVKFNI